MIIGSYIYTPRIRRRRLYKENYLHAHTKQTHTQANAHGEYDFCPCCFARCSHTHTHTRERERERWTLVSESIIMQSLSLISLESMHSQALSTHINRSFTHTRPTRSRGGITPSSRCEALRPRENFRLPLAVDNGGLRRRSSTWRSALVAFVLHLLGLEISSFPATAARSPPAPSIV